jgi:hypothetical protein
MTQAQVARALRTAALVAASLGLAQAASAQRPSQEQIAAIRAACRSDYIAHCAGVPPGGAQALACLREHLASVSAACAQAVNAAGAASAPAPAAPEPAAAGSPTPAPPAAPAAGGRAAAALQRMQPSDQQFGIILEACGADIDSHCANVERGPGWQLECLRKNAASLSTGCEQVLVAIASTAPAAAPAAAPPAPVAAPPPAAAPAPPPAPAVTAPAPAPAGPRARPTREQVVAIFRACRGDMREYCAGGERAPGSRMRCLRENAANLSPECQEALAAVASGAPGAAPAAPPPAALPRPARPVSPREVMFLIRSSCGADVRSLCRGVEPGGGRIIRCLRENAANLSPGCRQAFMGLSGAR